MYGMSGPYPIRGSVLLPEAELMWRFSRSSGPGGQHVNTSDSQVELRFDLARTEALPEVWKQRALERLAGRLTDGVVTVRGLRAPFAVAQPRDRRRTPRGAARRGHRAPAQAPQADPHPARHQRTTAAGEEAALRDEAGALRARLGVIRA
ncbi:ribosome-associated protein [Streptomyces calvus]